MPIPPAILARDNVFHTVPPLTYQAAMALLQRIVDRDATVLNGLLGDPLELAYFRRDPEQIFRQEWGVARDNAVAASECILIAGGRAGVQWAPFLAANLVPLAHSHPFHNDRPATSRALPAAGVPWTDLNGTAPAQNLHARLLVFPSQGDVAFAAAANLAVHTVYTPYCVVGVGPGRLIMNHDAPAAAGAPRLVFRLENVRWRNNGQYECAVTALAGNVPFWRAPRISVHGGGATMMHV